MDIDSARARSVEDTRNRILDVALETLGQDPDAGMGEIAAAAGVVRRTVYGHFPSRVDLVRTLAGRAVDEIARVLAEADAPNTPADAVWAEFVARVWPLTHRYRVLLALRRGEYGHEIHALLGPVDDSLADLVRRGQDTGVFGRHLPAAVLGQLAFSTVFVVADHDLLTGGLDAESATATTLLLLGVSAERAENTLVVRGGSVLQSEQPARPRGRPSGGFDMAIDDDDITSEAPDSGEGPADGGANPNGHDGGADGSADSGEGPADGGANPNGHDGGADGSADSGEGPADGGANPNGHDGGADGGA